MVPRRARAVNQRGPVYPFARTVMAPVAGSMVTWPVIGLVRMRGYCSKRWRPVTCSAWLGVWARAARGGVDAISAV
ncbi:hypothetical protein BGK72_00535 [Streptomyces agglomeratus]|nr:hypothetical protein BGK72_00535 [Streptomyces agglomeratus]